MILRALEQDAAMLRVEDLERLMRPIDAMHDGVEGRARRRGAGSDEVVGLAAGVAVSERRQRFEAEQLEAAEVVAETDRATVDHVAQVVAVERPDDMVGIGSGADNWLRRRILPAADP